MELLNHDLAVLFIKQNKKLLLSKFADHSQYPPENEPVSLFMAGSPGAGKTEFSRRLIEELNLKVVRIDADDIRDIIPGYDGSNSYIVQGACSLGVEYIQDYALEKSQSYILDATFASWEKAQHNIQRCLDKGRLVEIFYLYIDPIIAWDFTKKRESLEGRNVPKDIFLDAFFQSRENVNRAKELFKENIKLNLVVKKSLEAKLIESKTYLNIPYILLPTLI